MENLGKIIILIKLFFVFEKFVILKNYKHGNYSNLFTLLSIKTQRLTCHRCRSCNMGCFLVILTLTLDGR